MKKLVLSLLLIVSSVTMGSLAQTNMSNDDLLQAMDFARYGAFFALGQSSGGSGTLTMEILAERPDGSKRAVIQGSNKNLPSGFVFRIDYLEPEELAGDVFIITQDEIFFWNPDLITPLMVNGRFEVFGDATVAEVAGIFFSGNYTVIERLDVTLEDGSAGLQMNMVATHDFVAFPKAEVTANAETLQPVNLKLFDESGDLLHDNTYESYTEFDAGPIFKQQLLDNRVVPVNQTLLNLLTFQIQPLDDDLFDPNLLGE